MASPVTLYTDGACSGNPGPGGWAALLIDDGVERVVSGAEPHTTNQRMEDLWERLIAETRRHDVVWHKVKGHSGHALNDRVDALARGAIATLVNH